MENEDKNILIIRYLLGEATAGERQSLLEWVRAGEDNLAEFKAFKDAYDLGRLPHEMKNARTDAEWKRFRETARNIAPRKKDNTLRLRTLLKYAAVLVIGLVSVPVFNLLFSDGNKAEPGLTFIETGIGERSRIVLPDSTVMWLNSCSSISFNDFNTAGHREVSLNGEAYFEVKKNADKPFLVNSQNITYKVTGTAFNVSSFGGDRRETLALVEGGVTLSYGSYTREVKPGEVVEFDREENKFRIRYSDPSRLSHWRTGELAFDKMTFAELARKLERNFAVKFVFVNDEMKQETFGGTFNSNDNIETILKVINTSTPMKYRIEGHNVYIY